MHLRPLLLNAVPNTVVIDAHFLKKLRTRVALYHATNIDDHPLTDIAARNLSSGANVTESEMSVLNDDHI